MSDLDFETLFTSINGHTGKTEVACPLCGPECKSGINQRRKVLAVWYEGRDIITYGCARCGASGVALEERGARVTRRPVERKTKQAPAPDRRKKARELWDRSVPISGTVAELYLRNRQCFADTLTKDVRFLPGSDHFPPSMIARFSSHDGSTNGVHLTRLTKDGRKAELGDKPAKIMLGPSASFPLKVCEAVKERELFLTDLYVAEGIEDALSLGIASGCAAWAAGSAGRIAAVVARARPFTRVFVAFDDDDAGHQALAKAKKIRPDLIPINFTELTHAKEKADANSVLQQFGVKKVQRCCERAAIQQEQQRHARAMGSSNRVSQRTPANRIPRRQAHSTPSPNGGG